MSGQRKAKGGATASIQRSDQAWLAGGGLSRPHTKIGVGSAKRLLTSQTGDAEELRAYLRDAPNTMPASDYDAEHGTPPNEPKTRQHKNRYREVPGGAPTLGKRR